MAFIASALKCNKLNKSEQINNELPLRFMASLAYYKKIENTIINTYHENDLESFS